MAEFVESLLQPLRIPAGWGVDYNIFTSHDPSTESSEYFYGSVLFAASNRRDGRSVELGFEPEGDPEGSYELHLHDRAKANDHDSNTCVAQVIPRDRLEIVRQIERFMALGSK